MPAELVIPAMDNASSTSSATQSRGSFYSRESRNCSHDVEEPEGHEQSSPSREYLFPHYAARDRRKSSLPDSIPCDRYACRDLRPHHKFRSHSVSVTDPVCRSTYESLPQSPAASFLAQFAQPDEYYLKRPRLEDGCILEDRYQVGKVIGRGSFSECREGTPLPRRHGMMPGDKVALKIVKCEDSESSTNLSDFDREIAVWKRLKHPNILPLLDCLRFDHARIAITPVAENGTLLEFIEKNGALSEEKARSLFRQIVEAVHHMHVEHGIAHRDIKLDNILLDAKLHPYLCDFGLSECVGRDMWKARNTSSTSLDGGSVERTEGDIFCRGSLWYLPPEELDPSVSLSSSVFDSGGDKNQGKGDIWALGVVLYGMVSGRLPFTDDFLPRLQQTVSQGHYEPLPDHFSPDLKNIIQRMLTVDVEKRPDVATLLQDPWLKV